MSETQPPASANRQPSIEEREINAKIMEVFSAAIAVNATLEQRGVRKIQGIVAMYDHEFTEGHTLSVQLDEERNERIVRMHGPRSGLEVEDPHPHYRLEMDVHLRQTKGGSWEPIGGSAGSLRDDAIGQFNTTYEFVNDSETNMWGLAARGESPAPSQEIADAFGDFATAYKDMYEAEFPIQNPPSTE